MELHPAATFMYSMLLSCIFFFLILLFGMFGWLVTVGPRVTPTFEQLLVIGSGFLGLALGALTIYCHTSVLYQQ